MNNQKIVNDFLINRLSNDGFEIAIPITSLKPNDFHTFTFKGIPNGICLSFSSEREVKEIQLEGIPHNLLKRIYRSKMLRVKEKPKLDMSPGAVMIFVNKAYLSSIRDKIHA